MNDRLSIRLIINDEGKLVPIDDTDYSEWGPDIYNHVVIERLLNFDSEVIDTIVTEVTEDCSYQDVKKLSYFELPYDGAFTYQKLILPIGSHAGLESGSHAAYYEDGELYIDGQPACFDDVWAIKADSDSTFWFDDMVFSIYNLVKCFILLEKERLNKILNNGCKFACTDNPDGAKSDFLAAAILVLQHLIAEKKFVEAQTLLNRLNTCNGLCKDVKGSLKGCGCG